MSKVELLVTRISPISRHKINGGSYSTRFGQLLTDENHQIDVNYIVLGGEAMISVPNVRGKVFNTYGPTEFTVDATYFELERGKKFITRAILRVITKKISSNSANESIFRSNCSVFGLNSAKLKIAPQNSPKLSTR